MKKKKIGISLFILAIVFLAWGFQSTITGNVISNNFLSYQSFFQGLGLAFLIGSVLVLTSKKSLDYLIIPTGQTEENPKRVEKALQEWDKDYIKRLTISGDAGKPLKDSERATIYKILRKHKVKPKEIFISGGKDSKENIEYFFKKLGKSKNKVKDIGIVSYPDHLDRFENYLKEAKQKGTIPKRVKIHRIETDETLKEEAYGKLAKLKDKYSVLKYLNNKTFVGHLLKKIIS